MALKCDDMLLTIDFDAEERRISAAEHDDAKQQLLYAKKTFTTTYDAERALSVCDKYMRQRIMSLAESYAGGINQLLTDLFASKINFVSAVLKKSSTRTGFHENLQFSTVKEQSKTVDSLTRLTKNGKNTIRLPGYDKSIDFLGYSSGASGKRYRVLFCAKYTKGEGGSQDNQRINLESFAKAAPSIRDRSTDDILVLLADGQHYEKKRLVYGDVSFIDYWRKMAFGKRLVVSDTAHLDIEMKKLLEQL